MYVCAAEMRQLEVRDWFGQGGSGAPIKDANGHILTDYNSRRVSLLCCFFVLLTYSLQGKNFMLLIINRNK